MALNCCEHPTEYLDLLRKSADEQDALFNDFTINVTGFFRDPEAFAWLEQHVVPDLVKAHTGDGPLRAWVPGCSTGEEAFSIAMLLFEAMAAAGKQVRVQVFATDVNADSLEVARARRLPGFDRKRAVAPSACGAFSSIGTTATRCARSCASMSSYPRRTCWPTRRSRTST